MSKRRRILLPTRPRVAIVGANFAGLRAAQGLGSGFDVTVFDPSLWFEWLPNIHELVSGVKRPSDLRLARKRLVAAAGHRFVRAAVTGIDARRGILETANGTVHEFDYCIVAVGGVEDTYGVRGVERHALPFRNVEQCDVIGRRLAALMKGRKPRSIVIVGGGFAGVEALGEILRRYRLRANLTLHVVEAGPRLMSGVSPKIDADVRKHVRAYDVHIHTGSSVAAITPTGVRLQGGKRLHSDLTIWTGGGVAPPLLHAAKLAPKPRQWAPVDATLRSRRHHNVFVIGDAAALPEPIPKQAFHALEMAECAAANVRRAAARRALRPYRPSRTPLLVAFGDLDTFLVAGRSVVANPALAAGKEAVYQVTMAQIDPPSSVQALGQLASRVISVTRRLAPSK
ncbi:MAG: FAD-dependent oxidoreductase [Gammaproteobacteria bacterium]|nr:FAD-dependent oxidoreductase [Gammaproteobacteria bacterium]MDH5272833.1 FAD-dependent oxidoreductase [Gammaproteobacteria bacterium]